MQEYVLYGGGGHGKVVLEALLASGNSVLGVFDENKSGMLMQVPFLGSYNSEKFQHAQLIISIGDNRTRYRLAQTIGHKPGTVVHKSAKLAHQTTIHPGAMILHGAIVQTASVIGSHAIINTGAIVEHDNLVGDYTHIAPGAILCGGVEVGKGALVGAGAVILPGVSVGKWAVVGAGAVVTRSIPAGVLAYGNPARIVKSIGHVEN